jgi:hypothetical protein
MIILKTPFKRKVRDPSNIQCVPESDVNPYTLFCIRTRFVRIIEKSTNHAVDVYFFTEYSENIGNIMVKVDIIGVEKKSLTSSLLQEILDDVIKNHNYFCLLFHSNVKVFLDDGSEISQEWIKEIFKSLFEEILSKKINFPLIIEEEEVFVKLPSDTEYNVIYEDLQMLIVNKIKMLYRQGAIINVSKDIIKNWRLKRKGSFFYADWKDRRIAKDITKFLIEKRNGVKGVLFPGHFQLQNFKTEIEGEGTRVYVNNIEEAFYVAGLLRHYSFLRISE